MKRKNRNIHDPDMSKGHAYFVDPQPYQKYLPVAPSWQQQQVRNSYHHIGSLSNRCIEKWVRYHLPCHRAGAYQGHGNVRRVWCHRCKMRSSWVCHAEWRRRPTQGREVSVLSVSNPAVNPDLMDTDLHSRTMFCSRPYSSIRESWRLGSFTTLLANTTSRYYHASPTRRSRNASRWISRRRTRTFTSTSFTSIRIVNTAARTSRSQPVSVSDGLQPHPWSRSGATSSMPPLPPVKWDQVVANRS
jgi:hypothetical protein